MCKLWDPGYQSIGSCGLRGRWKGPGEDVMGSGGSGSAVDRSIVAQWEIAVTEASKEIM